MIPGIRLHVPPPEVLPPIHVYTGLPVTVLSHGHPEVSVPSLLALLLVVRIGAGTAARGARVVVGKIGRLDRQFGRSCRSKDRGSPPQAMRHAVAIPPVHNSSASVNACGTTVPVVGPAIEVPNYYVVRATASASVCPS